MTARRTRTRTAPSSAESIRTRESGFTQPRGNAAMQEQLLAQSNSVPEGQGNNLSYTHTGAEMYLASGGDPLFAIPERGIPRVRRHSRDRRRVLSDSFRNEEEARIRGIYDHRIGVGRDENGGHVIESNNIRMVMPGIGDLQVPQDPAERAAFLQQIAARKDQDDQAAYGLTTEQIRQSAMTGTADERYFGSEQHWMFAYASAARTNFQVPPEFFMNLDPFGGTAGNGPQIQPGGGTGELLSTISMAHDPDWLMGRYFGAGPLSALNGASDAVRPAFAGLVGLTDNDQSDRDAGTGANWLAGIGRGRPTTANDEENALLNSVNGQFYMGTRGSELYHLSDDNPAGASVQFSPEFIRDHNGGDMTSNKPTPTPGGVRFPEQHIWRR